jgi:hypothetical protein
LYFSPNILKKITIRNVQARLGTQAGTLSSRTSHTINLIIKLSQEPVLPPHYRKRAVTPRGVFMTAAQAGWSGLGVDNKAIIKKPQERISRTTAAPAPSGREAAATHSSVTIRTHAIVETGAGVERSLAQSRLGVAGGESADPVK